jgi:prepilin peptidase CpaA
MYRPFFPSLEFGWAFVGVLGVLLALAAVVDLRWTVIPKKLSLSLLALGLLANLVRGAWLGDDGSGLWLLPTDNPWTGGLDGLLFGLGGAVVSFLMIFILWILGTCGGGDVKLFAGLGAWLGPLYPIYVLAVSLGVLVLFVLVKAVFVGIKPRKQHRRSKAAKPGKEKTAPPEKWRITYSLPVALATAVVVLWVFRVELRLAPPRSVPSHGVQAHAS